jgi:hypothetical protein
MVAFIPTETLCDDNTNAQQANFLVQPRSVKWSSEDLEQVIARCADYLSIEGLQKLGRVEGGVWWPHTDTSAHLQRFGQEGRQIRWGFEKNGAMLCRPKFGPSLQMVLDTMRAFEQEGHRVCMTQGFKIHGDGLCTRSKNSWLVRRTHKGPGLRDALIYRPILPIQYLPSTQNIHI